MARRNKRKKTTETLIIPKELVLQAEKPRYNPFQGGTGAHKTAKTYTRKTKHKERLY